MITLETGVRIERPIDEVFDYVSEPRNFPRWNSAVQAVRKKSAGGDNSVHPTYLIERSLLSGRAVNELEIVSHERPDELAIRTTSGPTPFGYRFRFAQQDGATVIEVRAETELGAAADLLAPLVRRAVQRSVDDNLVTLKAILEARPSREQPARRIVVSRTKRGTR